MLTGEYRHSIDAKNRLFIPAKHRENLGPSFVIAKDIRTPILKVYSLEAWEAYTAPIKNMERKLAERFARFLFPGANTHQHSHQHHNGQQDQAIFSKILFQSSSTPNSFSISPSLHRGRPTTLK